MNGRGNFPDTALLLDQSLCGWFSTSRSFLRSRLVNRIMSGRFVNGRNMSRIGTNTCSLCFGFLARMVSNSQTK